MKNKCNAFQANWLVYSGDKLLALSHLWPPCSSTVLQPTNKSAKKTNQHKRSKIKVMNTLTDLWEEVKKKEEPSVRKEQKEKKREVRKSLWESEEERKSISSERAKEEEKRREKISMRKSLWESEEEGKSTSSGRETEEEADLWEEVKKQVKKRMKWRNEWRKVKGKNLGRQGKREKYLWGIGNKKDCGERSEMEDWKKTWAQFCRGKCSGRFSNLKGGD